MPELLSDLIDWTLVPILLAYVFGGLLVVPLMLWAALQDDGAPPRLVDSKADAPSHYPGPGRHLKTGDLRNFPGATLLLLPPALFLALYVSWTLAMVPAALAPVFAGWWWRRLCTRGIRMAHVYAWLAMVMPSVAWGAAVLLHINDYHWLSDDYSAAELTWWTVDDLLGGRAGLGLVVATIAASGILAVRTARTPSLRWATELATSATVPLVAIIWMSVPAGPAYIAWVLAILGYFIARRRGDLEPRVSGASDHMSRSQASGARSSSPSAIRRATWLAQFGALAFLSAATLSLLHILPPHNLAVPVAKWSAVCAFGLITFVTARRGAGNNIAWRLAIFTQLASIAVSTVLLAGNWAIRDEQVSGEYFARWLIFALSAQAATLAVVVIAAWATLTWMRGRQRFGSLLLGASWPIVMLFAMNVHGIDPTRWELLDDWAPSQVVSVVIGMSLWVGAMWLGYAVDETRIGPPQVQSATSEAEVRRASAGSVTRS